VDRNNDSLDPRENNNPYDATDATERKGDATPTNQDAAAQSIGAGSPEDLPDDTFASRGAVKQTVGIGRSTESGSFLFPAFDDHHPPEKDLIDDCVHCGFCLPTCPTYVLFGEEMDSPRGRIYLMNKGLNEEPMNDQTVRHWDLCLGLRRALRGCSTTSSSRRRAGRSSAATSAPPRTRPSGR